MSNDSTIVTTNRSSSLIRNYINMLRWNPHSKELLNQSEAHLLSSVKVPFKLSYVSIGDCVGKDDKIWTFSANTESENIPIVLIHGYGSGLALWIQNFDELAQNHPVYAIDLLGFGKSFRPNFSDHPEEIEKQYCESIERWRKAVNISKMVLIGHSFGGFLSSLYVLRNHEDIEHLILVDPWGLNEKVDLSYRPFWYRTLLRFFDSVSPLEALRFAGPLGEWVLNKTCQSFLIQYKDSVEDLNAVATYMHQINTDNPSGEYAFKRTSDGPFARNPIGEKLKENLSPNMPVTFLYGAQSWMSKKYGKIIQESRPNSYTNYIKVDNAGHVVYADNAKDFNKFVLEACKILKSKVNEE